VLEEQLLDETKFGAQMTEGPKPATLNVETQDAGQPKIAEQHLEDGWLE